MNHPKAETTSIFPTDKLPVMLCDQLNAEAAMIDLSAADPTANDAVLWRWVPSAENGFAARGFRHRIDDCKLKYSNRLQKHVLCVTSSAGFIGLAEYPSGKKIWEDFASDYGPHSIDYLPSGNIVVALSGNGHEGMQELRLYACDEDGIPTSDYSKVPFASAHGVVWDEERNLVWALGRTTLAAFAVEGTPQAPVLKQVDGLGCPIPPHGHDLSISIADRSRLYISSNSVYLFDKNANALISSFDGDGMICTGAVKSITEHTDGSLLRTVAANVYAGHNTNVLDIFRKDHNGTWTKKSYVFENRAFYKARPVVF